MFEKMNRNEKAGLVAAFIVVIGVSAAAGFYGAEYYGNPTGMMSSKVSSSDIRQDVQTILDQQIKSQRQQLMMMAQQNENISAEDIAISADVGMPESSDISGLMEVPITVNGQVPSRTGEVKNMSQDTRYYVSADGKLLFQKPTEIESVLSQLESKSQQQIPGQLPAN